MEKFHRFSLAVETNGATLLVEAELAHLAVLLRRFYDLLQKVAKDAGALAKDLGDPSRRLFENLPNSFADIALHGDRPRTAEEIASKWKLAPPIAAFYAAEALHFALIRAIRVAIEHHGQSPGLVVALPEGMAVILGVPTWDKLPIWNATTTTPNQLGSARAIFAFLISDVLDLSSRFVRAYWSCIATPPAIAEGFRCYLRNAFSHHLVMLPQILAQPWERARSAY